MLNNQRLKRTKQNIEEVAVLQRLNANAAIGLFVRSSLEVKDESKKFINIRTDVFGMY